MAYSGSGGPTIIYYDDPVNMTNPIRIDLPVTDKGKREDTYEDETDRFENIDGKYISGPPRWRFTAKYNFASVTGGHIDKLMDIYNRSNFVKLIPHIDFPMICYDCLIDSVAIIPQDGYIMKDEIEMELTSVNYIYTRPSIDNLIGCMFAYRIGVRVNE